MGAQDAVSPLRIDRGKRQVNLVISVIVIPSEAFPGQRAADEARHV